MTVSLLGKGYRVYPARIGNPIGIGSRDQLSAKDIKDKVSGDSRLEKNQCHLSQKPIQQKNALKPYRICASTSSVFVVASISAAKFLLRYPPVIIPQLWTYLAVAVSTILSRGLFASFPVAE